MEKVWGGLPRSTRPTSPANFCGRRYICSPRNHHDAQTPAFRKRSCMPLMIHVVRGECVKRMFICLSIENILTKMNKIIFSDYFLFSTSLRLLIHLPTRHRSFLPLHLIQIRSLRKYRSILIHQSRHPFLLFHHNHSIRLLLMKYLNRICRLNSVI